MPEANKETLLASAFNRNHKISQEGGVIDEEYRVEYVADRTNTFGKAFLGLTFERARCHDHKYDPIPQRDYYGTFFFQQGSRTRFRAQFAGAGSRTYPSFRLIYRVFYLF